MGQGIDLLGGITRILPEQPPPPIDLTHARAALIIKLSSIGDVVHALPVASALKCAYPALRLTWAGEEWAAPLVIGHPCVDRVVVFPTLVRWPSKPFTWARLLNTAMRELRSEQYDVAIDLQGLARSAIISAFSRSSCRLARAGQREGAHLVSFGVALPDSQLHAVDEYLCLARNLGAPDKAAVFSLPVSADARQSVARMLRSHEVSDRDRLIVVNPSAARRWKQWPLERWVAVVDALGTAGTVVIVGAAANARAHCEIRSRVSRPLVDFTGRTTLAELVALIERASLHVASDTGTIHIAVALGTPVVGIYGPTSPLRVGPYQRADCAMHHREQCGASCPAYCVRQRRCLTAVTPGEVIAKAHEALAEAEAFA